MFFCWLIHTPVSAVCTQISCLGRASDFWFAACIKKLQETVCVCVRVFQSVSCHEVVSSIFPSQIISAHVLDKISNTPDILAPFNNRMPFGLLPLRETDDKKRGGGAVTTLLFSLLGSCIQHKWHSLASLRA